MQDQASGQDIEEGKSEEVFEDIERLRDLGIFTFGCTSGE